MQFVNFWIIVLLTLVGCCVGSFLNVAIYRIPLTRRRDIERAERIAGNLPVGPDMVLSVAYPPSHCTKCKTPIKGYDNIPIISWFILGGKCRSCKVPFSARYPIIEAAAGLWTLISLLALDISVAAIVSALLGFLIIYCIMVRVDAESVDKKVRAEEV